MKRRILHSKTKQLLASLILGAVTCGSMLSAPNFSHADPAPGAQDDGYPRQPAGNAGNQDADDLVIVRGTITRNLPGDQFEMRSADGRTLRVAPHESQPYRLTAGDRVEVRGRFVKNILVAQDIQIVQDEDASIMVSGQVTRDLPGEEFEMRTDDGHTYRVVPHETQPANLAVGDRVEVRGHLDRNIFIAHDVFLPDKESTPAFTGSVTRDLLGDEFEMRAADGKIWRVIVRETEPEGIAAGDRVEVHGTIVGNLLIADTVRVVRGEDDGEDDITTLRGTVAHDPAGNEFWLRMENEQTMRIIMPATAPAGLSTGDRVEVRGRAQNGAFAATSILILDNNDDREDYRSVNFPATILTIPSASQLTVRGDNGRTYEIRTRTNISSLKVGDHIRIIGRGTRNTVEADEIIKIPDANRPGQLVTVIGTITGISRTAGTNGYLLVRGDNGIRHRVLWRNIDEFKTGQRVRVVGTYDKDVINATSVTRL